MKKRQVLLLMTTMLIALSGCSKQPENKTASYEKAVASEQSAPEEEETTTEEQEEAPQEETVNLQSVTGYQLNEMMDDVALILGRNCINWKEETVTPWMVEDKAKDDEEVEFTDTQEGEWNFEEIIHDMYLKIREEGHPDSFRVSTGCVATNFNEPYRYNQEEGSDEDLYTLTKISFSATDDKYETESTKDIYAIVRYNLIGETWMIADIQYMDEMDVYSIARYYGCKDYSQYEDFFFNRDFNTDNSSIVYDVNIKDLVTSLDTSDLSTYQTLFNQIYQNEINDEDFDSDYSDVKCSVAYVDDDDIPEMVLWWFEKESEGFCWQAKIYHYSGKCLHARTIHAANGLTDNVTYTPKNTESLEHLLVKTMDTDFETTWTEYKFYADTVHANEDTYIMKQEPQNNEYRYIINGEPADSAEEVQEHISSLGMETTFTIYDSIDEAFANLE